MTGADAMMPSRYYTLQVPRMIADGTAALDPMRKADIDHFANHCGDTGELLRVFRTMINHLFPVTHAAADPTTASLGRGGRARSGRENGFDPVQHDQLREDLQRGRIGLARNRLPVDVDIRDVEDADLISGTRPPAPRGRRARRGGAPSRARWPSSRSRPGVGSRWTTGAGVVKAVNPFVMLAGRHRSFLEIHLAKTRKTQARFGRPIPHVVTTSYLTHSAIERHLAQIGQLRPRRPGLPLARPVDRPAARSRWPAT